MRRICNFVFFSVIIASFLCSAAWADSYTLTILNENGEKCYNANSDTAELIFEDSAGNTVTLASAGDPIPGLTGSYIGDFILGFDMNDNGVAAFLVNIEDSIGTNLGQGLLKTSSGGPLTLIAATDQISDGHLFGRFEDYVHINSSGQISFVADIDKDADPAVCRYNPVGRNRSAVERRHGYGLRHHR